MASQKKGGGSSGSSSSNDANLSSLDAHSLQKPPLLLLLLLPKMHMGHWLGITSSFSLKWATFYDPKTILLKRNMKCKQGRLAMGRLSHFQEIFSWVKMDVKTVDMKTDR